VVRNKVPLVRGTRREARRIACDSVIQRPHDMALAGISRAFDSATGKRKYGCEGEQRRAQL